MDPPPRIPPHLLTLTTHNPQKTALKTLRNLIGTAQSTSLGGIPLYSSASGAGSGSGQGQGTSASASVSDLRPGEIPWKEKEVGAGVSNATTVPTSTSKPSSTSTSTPTLADLTTRIERASGESYSRGKVLRDEVRGVGEVLGRR